jgi:transposase
MGGITAEAYNEYILSQIQEFFNDPVNVLEGYIFMQDNTPAYRALETRLTLFRRRIPYIKFPPYSPDLNSIEHVWN